MRQFECRNCNFEFWVEEGELQVVRSAQMGVSTCPVCKSQGSVDETGQHRD